MITTVTKGKRIGVSRDEQAVGYAVRVNRAKQPEQWTAYVYTTVAPFDFAQTGFATADAAVSFIATNGAARNAR